MLSTMSMTAFREQVQRKKRLPAPAVAEAIRLAAGWSRAELAAHLGVSPQALYLWEKALRRPRPANRDKYAEALEILQEGQ